MGSRETTKAIEAAVMKKYLHQQSHWAVLREVTIDDPAVMEELAIADKKGWERQRALNRATSVTRRRIDILLINLKRAVKVPHERIALEIKVTRADFFRDTEDKRRAWMQHCHRFAYVTPKGLVTKDEVPPGCGLIEYEHRGWDSLTWKVKAPAHNPTPRHFDGEFFVYMANRLSNTEQKLRSLASA